MDERSEPVLGRELIRERIEHTLERDLSSLLSARRRDEPIPEGGFSERSPRSFGRFRPQTFCQRRRPPAGASASREPPTRSAPRTSRSGHRSSAPESASCSRRASHDSPTVRPPGAPTAASPHASLRWCSRSRAWASCRMPRRRPSISARAWDPGTKPAPGRPSSTALRRVVAGPPQRHNGVRVSTAELWGDRVKLWWNRVSSPQERAERERERMVNGARDALSAQWRRAAGTFVLSDDLGTSYEPEICFGSEQTPWTWLTPLSMAQGEPLPLWGHATFMPAVP